MTWKKVCIYFGGMLLLFVIISTSITCVSNEMLFRKNREITNEKRIEEEVRRNLPVGSSYQEIDHYLTETGYIHNYDQKDQAFYASTDSLAVSGLIWEQLSTTIVRWKAVVIKITLDQEQRLKTIAVKVSSPSL